MPGFEIQTYTVTCEEGGFGWPPAIDRRIYVESLDHSPGVRYRASLEFGPRPAAWEEIGVALNVGGPNLTGITMLVFLPPDWYTPIHDLLRSEKPARLMYNLRDLPANPEGTTKYITHAAIGSGLELPGEDPMDPESLV